MNDEIIDLEKCPNDWPRVQLGSICDVIGGFAAPKGDEPFKDGEIPFVRMRDLGKYHRTVNLTETDGRLNMDYLKSHKCKIIKKGTILLPRSGSVRWNHRAVLGVDACIVSHICALVVKDPSIDNMYLYYILCNFNMQKIMKRTTGLDAITFDDLKQISVPIAPYDIQKKIARILIKVEEVINKRTKTLVDAKLLMQTLLISACSGSLTADWRKEHPDVKPASSLLEEIKITRQNTLKKNGSKNRKYSLLKEYEMKEYKAGLAKLPKNWEWSALGNYAVCSRGKFSIRPRDDPSCYGGQYPFIQIGDLSKDGGLIESHSQTLNEKGLSVSKMFPAGIAVIAIVGASIGNTGILKYDTCFPDSLVGIETGSSARNQYVEFFLRMSKDKIQSLAYAGGGQPNIKLETLNPLPIALPPLEEQEEIVRRINIHSRVIERIKKNNLKLLYYSLQSLLLSGKIP